MRLHRFGAGNWWYEHADGRQFAISPWEGHDAESGRTFPLWEITEYNKATHSHEFIATGGFRLLREARRALAEYLGVER